MLDIFLKIVPQSKVQKNNRWFCKDFRRTDTFSDEAIGGQLCILVWIPWRPAVRQPPVDPVWHVARRVGRRVWTRWVYPQGCRPSPAHVGVRV